MHSALTSLWVFQFFRCQHAAFADAFSEPKLCQQYYSVKASTAFPHHALVLSCSTNTSNKYINPFLISRRPFHSCLLEYVFKLAACSANVREEKTPRLFNFTCTYNVITEFSTLHCHVTEKCEYSNVLHGLRLVSCSLLLTAVLGSQQPLLLSTTLFAHKNQRATVTFSNSVAYFAFLIASQGKLKNVPGV